MAQKVKCHICKRWFKTLYAHLRTHGVSPEQYSKRFPTASLRADGISFAPTIEGRKRTGRAVRKSNLRRWKENREGELSRLDKVRSMRTSEDHARSASKQMTPEKKQSMKKAVIASNRKRWKENREGELKHLSEISRVSKECINLYQSVVKVFPDAELSVWDIIQNQELDIWIPSKRLAIEYHGLWWHSMAVLDPSAAFKDYKKYRSCKDKNIRLLQIYSDDWSNRRKTITDMLGRLAKPKDAERVYKLRAREISGDRVRAFLDVHHYLSGHKATGTLYVGLFSNKTLYAVSVFKRVGNTVEWIRHAFRTGYRAWNPASLCLKFLMEELDPARVVSFSDNRLHTGKTYQSIGFRNDGQTCQSYEYTDGRRRVHKKRFRVAAGLNEEAEAASQGWYRVYDSRKTRWILEPDR